MYFTGHRNGVGRFIWLASLTFLCLHWHY